MPLKPVDAYLPAGVDSRSNPCVEPRERSLYTRNWVPGRAGWLQLRDGYQPVTMSAVTATPIHSAEFFKKLDGLTSTKYLLYGQGTTWRRMAVASGVVDTPAVKGSAIASSEPWSFFSAMNHIYGCNGTDQKWFDGDTWRDIGLRSLTVNELVNVVIAEGVREISLVEASAVTLGQASTGGSFSNSANGGSLIFLAYFDPTLDELGPATISVGAGRVNLTGGTATQKITLTGLPNLAGVNANWVKLVARTGDGDNNASFVTANAKGIATTVGSGAALTITVPNPGHGVSAGDIVSLTGQSEDTFNGVYQVQATPDANTFTVRGYGMSGNSTSGVMTKLDVVANAATTHDITGTSTEVSFMLANDYDIASVIVNAERGIPPSTVGSEGNPNPGYVFYGCIYNRVGGGAVGNRTIFTSTRFVNTVRCNARIGGLPDLSSEDPEWEILIGRTGDGAAVPYTIADQVNNWHSVGSGRTSTVITEAKTDGGAELPTRNGKLQATAKAVAQVGDEAYAIVSGSSFVYKCGKFTDSRLVGGTFVGDPAQAWAATAEMFPLAEEPVGIHEYGGEVFVGTLDDLAILNLQGPQPGWMGPFYGGGFASQRAWCKGWKGLPFWINGKKQLMTMESDGPVVISDEYEAALLKSIADSQMAKTELQYVRVPEEQKDFLQITGVDANGKAVIVYHDFNLRDERSPYGQGYDARYGSTLENPFITVPVRDANNTWRLWAGGQDGQIYQLFTGGNDNGQEFTCDQVTLVYTGPNNQMTERIEWFGDSNLEIYFSKKLNTAFAIDQMTKMMTPKPVDGEQGNSHYFVNLARPEFTHCYLWLRLTSHSADGTLAFNMPPHMPLESYGRIFLVTPLMGNAKGKP